MLMLTDERVWQQSREILYYEAALSMSIISTVAYHDKYCMFVMLELYRKRSSVGPTCGRSL